MVSVMPTRLMLMNELFDAARNNRMADVQSMVLAQKAQMPRFGYGACRVGVQRTDISGSSATLAGSTRSAREVVFKRRNASSCGIGGQKLCVFLVWNPALTMSWR